MDTPAYYIHGDTSKYDAAAVRAVATQLQQAAIATGVSTEDYSLRYEESSDLFILSCPSSCGQELNDHLGHILRSTSPQNLSRDDAASPTVSEADTFYTAMPDPSSDEDDGDPRSLDIAALLGKAPSALHFDSDDDENNSETQPPLDIAALLGKAPPRHGTPAVRRDSPHTGFSVATRGLQSLQQHDSKNYNKLDDFGLKGHAENTAKWQIQMADLSIGDETTTSTSYMTPTANDDMSVEHQAWSSIIVPSAAATATGDLLNTDLGIADNNQWPVLSQSDHLKPKAKDHTATTVSTTATDSDDLANVDVNLVDSFLWPTLFSPSHLKSKAQDHTTSCPPSTGADSDDLIDLNTHYDQAPDVRLESVSAEQEYEEPSPQNSIPEWNQEGQA
ncbi:hypothetical protein AMS68_003677 [Peltaster fructicola]|uniref:Uncharacterized protein n=1 Tax=Peltaster fructicola TaxID=286661 RepID=A0A6H0XUN4_9PEZI|nr:hypothetical protein AMS68_003677 [Peltaster fructicola]